MASVGSYPLSQEHIDRVPDSVWCEFLEFLSIDRPNREDQLEILDRYKGLLPLIEQDVLYMAFRGISQKRSAAILRVSQPTISYRLRSAARRLRFLVELPDLPAEADARAQLEPYARETLDLDIVWSYLHSGSQSATARDIGVSQGLARHRICRMLRRAQRTHRDDGELPPMIIRLQMLLDVAASAMLTPQRSEAIRYIVDE